MSDAERFRKLLQESLKSLADGMGDFRQTTHGAFISQPCRLPEVLERINNAYEVPSAFNFSELSQGIRVFLETEHHKEMG